MPGVITLTTDFGTDDPFVGIMKGVILSICPSVRIVDITHGIEPQNVQQAAWVLQTAWRWFPKNTVHVAVIDPGVGGERRALACKQGNAFFVGPDNGLFSGVLKAESGCHELTNKKYRFPEVSATFHGRDVFAPAAAWIAKDTPLKSFGPRIQDPVRLDWPEPVWNGKTIEGEIIYIDRFGNAASNIPQEWVAQHFPPGTPLTVKIGRTTVGERVSHYAEVSAGQTGAVINSWNLLEVFQRDGSAARFLKLKVGQKVRVTL